MITNVIIAGGRDFDDYRLLLRKCETVLAPYFNDNRGEYNIVIFSGKAKGADTLGEKFAKNRGIKVEQFAADWKGLGFAAGPIRNEVMVERADILIAFWDGQSKGTKNMIELALKYGLEIHVYRYG